MNISAYTPVKTALLGTPAIAATDSDTGASTRADTSRPQSVTDRVSLSDAALNLAQRMLSGDDSANTNMPASDLTPSINAETSDSAQASPNASASNHNAADVTVDGLNKQLEAAQKELAKAIQTLEQAEIADQTSAANMGESTCASDTPPPAAEENANPTQQEAAAGQDCAQGKLTTDAAHGPGEPAQESATVTAARMAVMVARNKILQINSALAKAVKGQLGGNLSGIRGTSCEGLASSLT